MLRAVRCVDLTTLSGDDTPGNVKRLCAKARNAVQKETLDNLGLPEDFTITTGAVCVYPSRVADAVKALEGSGIPVASVATGFPAGQTPLKMRLEEIKYAVEMGAKEIDIVLNRTLVFEGKWEEIYEEVVAMKKACGTAHLKTILATGEFPHYTAIWQASMVSFSISFFSFFLFSPFPFFFLFFLSLFLFLFLLSQLSFLYIPLSNSIPKVCMMAGADFIKTSTGKESVNAIIPVGLVMCRAIRFILYSFPSFIKNENLNLPPTSIQNSNPNPNLNHNPPTENTTN